MPTSRDVAQKAGVSQATVSRVLSNHPMVAEALRLRVREAIRELGYTPNAAARSMRTGSTGNIGVVTARLDNPVYPRILQLLGRELRHAGFRMVVWNSDATDDDAAADAARQGIVDGIIFTTATAASTRLYEAVTSSIPVVLINRTVESWPCDQVESDNHAGGKAVARYFLGAGRRRIGLIGGPPAASTIRSREAGFREGLLEGGVGPDQLLTVQAEIFSHEAGREAMRRLLATPSPAATVFCVNDVLALGACDAARVAGVRIPHDLWIVGYDDIEMASWPAFDLTTVHQPLDQMAQDAVRLLTARVAGKGEGHEHLCLPNDLVIRGSTGHEPIGEQRQPARARARSPKGGKQ
ncbi:MAG TPA: LacI family DNA-binding transcriptional regulator [Roseomonas sp.]